MARKIYFYNDDFFENIDSEKKAYFLGLLYADGYINDIGHNCYVELTLLKNDEYILYEFLRALESNRNVVRIKNDTYSRIIINSKKIVNDLKQLGCINKKTKILKFPTNIDEKYVHHLIRGYFDGDGSIWCHSNGRQYYIQFTGCIDFLSGIDEYISSHSNINKKNHYISCNRNRCEKIKALKYGGNYIVKKILDLLYYESTIFLNRKHEKYLSAVSSIIEKNHVVYYDNIMYDITNKSDLINIIHNKTGFPKYTISSKLIKGYKPDEIIKMKQIIINEKVRYISSNIIE